MKVNIERDIDVEQLLINLDSKSQCKRVGMAGYEVTVDKQLLRDAHDVIAQFMKEREEKTLVFAELENGTKTSGYYSTEEAGKALKKVIEKVNEEEQKQSCFGCHINGSEKCDLCIYERKCMIETEKNDKKSCFGNYQDVYMCRNCDQIKECIKKLLEKQDNNCNNEYKINKKGVPDCYNCYDDKDLECNNCEEREGCKIATDKRKQEELEELDDFI